MVHRCGLWKTKEAVEMATLKWVLVQPPPTARFHRLHPAWSMGGGDYWMGVQYAGTGRVRSVSIASTGLARDKRTSNEARTHSPEYSTRSSDLPRARLAMPDQDHRLEPVAYSVAVRELCEFAAKTGDLDHRFTPSPTAREGIAGH